MTNPEAVTKKARILVIDDERDIVTVLNKRLSDAGYQVFVSHNGVEGLEKARECRPDLIVLDVMMPEMDGMEVKGRLNQEESTAVIPVIFLTAKGNVDDKIEGLRLGADDYVTKPYDHRELLARIEAAVLRKRYYEEVSFKDGLTGLPNAGYFKKELTLFYDLAKRFGRVFSLVLMDIDDFKNINDRYGHLAGDLVLKVVGETLRSSIRKPDIIARYGGDEFALILQEADRRKSQLAIERLRREVESKSIILNAEEKTIRVSLSVGVATYSEQFATEVEMFKSADENMYELKRFGKEKARE